jgi:hypothetical protein
MLVNLITSNLRSEQFQRSFVLLARSELMTESESKLYPYERFQKRFPGNYGYHTFTRTGFNRDLTEAIFYTEHICGLCGEGKHVCMRKQGTKRLVEGATMTWVSQELPLPDSTYAVRIEHQFIADNGQPFGLRLRN